MNVEPLYLIGPGLLRSVLGWAKHSLKDGIIDDFELRQLGETIIRVGLIGLVIAYFPGINISFFEASIVALGSDLLFSMISKLRK